MTPASKRQMITHSLIVYLEPVILRVYSKVIARVLYATLYPHQLKAATLDKKIPNSQCFSTWEFRSLPKQWAYGPTLMPWG